MPDSWFTRTFGKSKTKAKTHPSSRQTSSNPELNQTTSPVVSAPSGRELVIPAWDEGDGQPSYGRHEARRARSLHELANSKSNSVGTVDEDGVDTPPSLDGGETPLPSLPPIGTRITSSIGMPYPIISIPSSNPPPSSYPLSSRATSPPSMSTSSSPSPSASPATSLSSLSRAGTPITTPYANNLNQGLRVPTRHADASASLHSLPPPPRRRRPNASIGGQNTSVSSLGALQASSRSSSSSSLQTSYASGDANSTRVNTRPTLSSASVQEGVEPLQ